MANGIPVGATPARAVWWRDPRWRSLIYQAIALAAVVAVGWYLVDNTLSNMERRGIASGFDFLENTAGFDIIQALIPYAATSSYGIAFLVGLINTILIGMVGIVFATILGFIIGVARLSTNWLIRTLATIYIETFRNIPLLLQILFWYHAVLKPLPDPKQSLNLFDIIFLNNRGLYLPSPGFTQAFLPVLVVFVAGIVGTVMMSKWAKRRQEATGQTFPVAQWGVFAVIGLPALVYLLMNFISGTPIDWGIAKLTTFNFEGGLVVIPEFIALLIALSVYTAAFIAEAVRSGIQAVSHGQSEAAFALGVRPSPTMKLIIIPQAMRVIIPQLTNQYLNLTKNSSLAVFIAYPDLVAVFMGTSLNQTGQAVEIVAMTMAVYLTLSLLTSGIMNWYNAKISLVER
jgi:general L-amino acid transport system permease protein